MLALYFIVWCVKLMSELDDVGKEEVREEVRGGGGEINYLH